jgi:hypothetical protein
MRIPRNDSRIEPLNHLLHYFAKTLGAVLPLLGGVVPSRGSALGEDGRPTIIGFMGRVGSLSQPSLAVQGQGRCETSNHFRSDRRRASPEVASGEAVYNRFSVIQ